MLVDEPLPGPPLRLYRGTASSFRWRVTQQNIPVRLDTDDVRRVVFILSKQVGTNAEIVATLSSEVPSEINIEAPDSSFFTLHLSAELTATLTLDSYWYSALIFNVAEEPEVLLLPASVFVKPVPLV